MFQSLKNFVSRVLDNSSTQKKSAPSGFFKKLRNKAGSPLVWGSIAVFSPTLVACYGQPYDIPDFDINYKSADCVDGYLHIVEELTNRRTGNTTERTSNTATPCTAETDTNKMLCDMCIGDAKRNNFINCSNICDTPSQAQIPPSPTSTETEQPTPDATALDK